MPTTTTDRRLVRVVLAIAIALVLPAFLVGFGPMGTGPMMDGMWGDRVWGASGASGWMLVIGVGMRFLFLAAVVGVIYLGYRAVTEQDGSDPALEELRAAYARGDLSDEEYERRRERLESDS